MVVSHLRIVPERLVDPRAVCVMMRLICAVKEGQSLESVLNDMLSEVPEFSAKAGDSVEVQWITAEQFEQIDRGRRRELH